MKTSINKLPADKAGGQGLVVFDPDKGRAPELILTEDEVKELEAADLTQLFKDDPA